MLKELVRAWTNTVKTSIKRQKIIRKYQTEVKRAEEYKS